MKPAKPRRRVMPEDEMSSNRALTRSTDVTRSYRPVPRPEGLADRAEEQRLMDLMERSQRAGDRERQDYEDFGGGAKKFAKGGMVRGCKMAQTTGKGFSGSY